MPLSFRTLSLTCLLILGLGVSAFGDPVGDSVVKSRDEGSSTKEYKNAQGKVVLIENYDSKGRLHGEVFGFYPNGKKKHEFSYEAGKPSGEWVFWFENGRIQEIRSYQDGKLHGLRRRWREGREPASVGVEPLKAKRDNRVPDGMECFSRGERKPIEVCSDPKFDTNSQNR